MNDQINSFALSQLTLGATCDFHAKVGKEINTAGAANLHVETLVPAYERVIADLQSVVNRQTAFVATASMKQADLDRDHLVGVIRSVVGAHATNAIEAKRQAALLLKAKLAPYAGINKHEYSKETAEVKGMLALLALEENAAAVEALHLDKEVEELAKANAAFEAAFDTKVGEAADRQAQANLDSRALCDRANTLYADILRTVNAYAIVQPSDEITAFIARMNGLVTVYASIAGSSKPSSGGSSAPADPSEPTDPSDPSDGEGGGGDSESPDEI